MATYVMSDVHGALGALKAMLAAIDFSETDTLYILGDVIDRGPDGVEILQLTMNTPNIILLLGNHEDVCLNFFDKNADEAIIRRWNRNGNYPTLLGFDRVGEEEKQRLLDYIRSLPTEIRLNVGGRDYILVHGFTGETLHDRVWSRPKLDTLPDTAGNERVIIGHTPVCEYVCPGSDEDMYVYSRKLTESGDHFRILHAKGFIDLDCCVGYGLSAARLACLRLDDGAEFYEKVEI